MGAVQTCDLRQRANAGCESLIYSEITPPLFPPPARRHLARKGFCLELFCLIFTTRAEIRASRASFDRRGGGSAVSATRGRCAPPIGGAGEPARIVDSAARSLYQL